MVPAPLHRRTLLTTAATLAGFSLAGCLADDGSPTGTGTEVGSALADGLAESALYDPDSLLDTTHDGFLALDVAAYREAASALPEPLVGSADAAAGEFALDPSALDRFTVVGGFDRADPDAYRDDRLLLSAAATGDLDADATADAVLEERRVEAVGDHRGRTVYARTNRYDASRSTAFAVGPGTLVGAMVDAGSGVADGRDRGDGDDGPLTRTATRLEGGHETTGGGETGAREESASGEETPRGGRTATAADGPSTPTVLEPPGGEPADVTARDAVELQLDALAGAADGYAPPVLADLFPDADAPLVGGLALDGDDLRDLLFPGEPGSDVAAAAGGLLAGLRAVAVAGSVEPGADLPVTVTIRLRYADATNADAATVEAFLAALRERDPVAAALDHVEVSAEAAGRELLIETDADARGAFRAFEEAVEANRPPRPPRLSLAFETADGGRVTVVHEGGDAVERLQVRYAVDGATRTETWTGPDGLRAGDAFTTAAAPDPGTRLRVVWESPDGGSAATVGMFAVPE